MKKQDIINISIANKIDNDNLYEDSDLNEYYNVKSIRELTKTKI